VKVKPELLEHLRIASAEPVSGGCIHEGYRVSIAGRSRFLKVNDARHADAFAAEADGLSALRTGNLPAPEPLAHGTGGGQAYLLLEYLELRSSGDFADLGRKLAHAHRNPGPRFGWARDNYIGSTPQKNAWCNDWAEFWVTRRLEPQISMAREKGFDVALPSTRVLENHKPQPSLLHGDLWSGNAGFTAQGPVVFDPAVYYGDREADLAMTELFGGFPREFYLAYNEAFPLAEGYEKRKHLYNLYHLLNHLNLFGGGYLGQVKETLRGLQRVLD
jgi:protein-ribulosamine 3-kinase